METLQTLIDTSSPEFARNCEHNRALAQDLRRLLAEVRKGGPPKYHERHAAQGKLFVRERINRLLDPGAPFLELSPLAAWGCYDDQAPGAGIVTGIGRVSGREVMIVANDATVKGGTYFPLTMRKHLRAQEIAWQNYLPCIYLVDHSASAEQRALLSRVYSVLDDLPANQRIAWSLRHIEGEPLENVASMSGCSLATAKRRIAAAAQRIEEAFADV